MHDSKPKGKGAAKNLMTPQQCASARGALGLTIGGLAELAGVSRGMIADFESGKRRPLPAMRNAVQRALEEMGAAFEGGDQPIAIVKFPNAEFLKKRKKGNE